MRVLDTARRTSLISRPRFGWEILIPIVAAPSLGYAIAQSASSGDATILMVGVIAVGVGVALFYPNFCLFLLVAATNVRTLLPELPARVSVADVLAALFLVSWAFRRGAVSASRPIPRWTGWILLFTAWAWISVFASSLAGSTGVTSMGRITLYVAVFFAATQVGPAKKILLPMMVLAAVEAIAVVLGIAPESRPSRPEGYLGDPQQFGLLLLLALPTARLVAGSVRRALLYCLFVVTLALSNTRSIWVAGISQLILMAAPMSIKRSRAATIALVLLIVGLAASQQSRVTQSLELDPTSLVVRQNTWSQGIQTVKDYPILGAGWGYFQEEGVFSPFNLTLNTAASTGIFGLLFLGAFLVMLTGYLYRRRLESRVHDALFIYLAGFLIVSLVENTLFADSPLTITFFAIMGLAVGEPMPEGADDPAAISVDGRQMSTRVASRR